MSKRDSGSAAAATPPPSAKLSVRLLSAAYEALLLAALLVAATGVFIAVAGDSTRFPQRVLLQVYLLAVSAIYFVWSWSGGRRTLPMRTWRLRLLDSSGAAPSVRTSLVRFLAALVVLPAAGIGFFWALLDPQRRFLHDRLAGTWVVRDPPEGGKQATGPS